jgi:hypothetical protein
LDFLSSQGLKGNP